MSRLLKAFPVNDAVAVTITVELATQLNALILTPLKPLKPAKLVSPLLPLTLVAYTSPANVITSGAPCDPASTKYIFEPTFVSLVELGDTTVLEIVSAELPRESV